jgi:iron complex outermembrane receptor protein
MPATGTTVGLGQTRRRGADLQVNARVSAHWTLWASHAIQQATVISAFTADGRSLAGNEVLATPRHITNIGADYRPDARWRFGIQGRRQGDYYVEESNQHGRYGGFSVLDASAGYALSDRLSVDLQVKNLTGRTYAYAWYDNFFWGGDNQPMFSPAPRRGLFVSLNLTL